MQKYSGKKIHYIIILLFLSTAAVAQIENDVIVQDTLRIDTLNIMLQDSLDVSLNDTLVGDSGYPVSSDAVEVPIIYNATDTMRMDMKGQKVFLVNNASATYGEIDLKAYYIELDLVTSDVYAYGRLDSAGKLVDTPIFKEGQEEFNCEQLHYNFKSKQAVIKNIVTEQEGSLLMHSEVTKMHVDGSLHMEGSKVSTCEADHPHFYIQLPKAKAFPGDKIISGPAFLVIEDVPLPLILPFGFFPVPKEVASGLIIPKYGEERGRGLFLKQGGYYFNFGEYVDLKVTGDMYTNGTWRLGSSSTYRKRYKFNGNFALSYANNVTGHKNLEDYSKSTNYSIRWSHSQDAKARPGSRFSASVNMSSSGYDRENSYSVANHVTTTKQSSVSYSKSWAGTPFNFSSSLNQSQNSSTKQVSVNLPKASLSMSRIYPLKSKNATTSRWWHDLQVQYSASLDNRINVADSLLFTDEVWQNMKNGFKHDIPITIPLRPIKNLSISPQIRYSGVAYTSKVSKRWEENYYDPIYNDTVSGVITDEIPGFFYGQAISPSISASYSPQIFGSYVFTNPDSKLREIRHVMKPSVSFSYVPSMEGLSTDMYREVQIDTMGNTKEYSIFESSIYGTPSLPSKSGSVSFSLINIIEAKVVNRNDTTGKGEKVKLLENLGLTTSFNPFLDSLKWSPVSLTLRTKLFKEMSVSARGSFDLYALDDAGRRSAEFLWNTDHKPFRLTTFNISVGFDLKRIIDNYFGSEITKTNTTQPQVDKGLSSQDGLGGRDDSDLTSEPMETATGSMMFGDSGYADFSLPWSLRVNYNFNYRKTAFDPTINQNMTITGTLTLTDRWAVRYSTGYDFVAKDITMTRVSIDRDLHCWQMSFNWIPIGYLKSWDFTLRVKASVLKDLKYERRTDRRGTSSGGR